MRINVIGDGSAGRRHERMLTARGHVCTILGPERASPATHPECDAAVIASPPLTHKLYLGWYWDKCPVLCEGPVTWIPWRFKRLRIDVNTGEPYEVDANEPMEARHPHMTASNWRFVPQVLELKEICQVRRVTHAHLWFDYDLARWRPGTDYKATCYYTDGIDLINPHEFDLALFLLGPSAEAHVLRASRGKSLGIDTVTATIHHESGALSTVNSSWFSASYQRGVKVYFEDGTSHEIGFTSPQDDAICNASYEAMIDAWLHGCNRMYTRMLHPHAASLWDGYLACKLVTGGRYG